MSAKYKYDLFISYATANKEIADDIVARIEARGYKCFIAPRDIKTGEDYAQAIVSAISNCQAVLLIFSVQSDKSGYVLREINSAVSRNKTIIPLRIEDFLPSEAMEFYLGVTHWLAAYPRVLDIHLDEVVKILRGIAGEGIDETEDKVKVHGPALMRLSEANKIGYDCDKITMREIEIDYLCAPPGKYNLTEDTEGQFDDWTNTTKEYEEDTSILLVKEDEIIGYCDIYPVTDEAYGSLIRGEVIIRDEMIDLFNFGGEFDAYIAMLAVDPKYASQNHYIMMFDWMIKHLAEWKKEGIHINHLGISVYTDILEKFVKRYGFTLRSINPVGGQVYEISVEELRKNPLVVKRFGDIDI